MKLNTMKDLFIDQLRDIYSAEQQLTKALPKMAKGASNANLKQGFLSHLKETEGQIERLEQIFEDLDEKPTGKTCAAMQGLVKEGSEVLETEGEESVLDAALIAAAQRVEHYEMAAYGCVREYAELLQMKDAVKLLQETLDEETQADKKLSDIAKKVVNREALRMDESADEESDEKSSASKRKESSQRRSARA